MNTKPLKFILGIESSCDETAAAVFDIEQQKILSNKLYSQVDAHTIYGGVVPEVASRSHLEKIDLIINEALDAAGVKLEDIDAIGATSKPGLAGSLLVGFCFAKTVAWAQNKKFLAIDHNEGHIFSSFLDDQGYFSNRIPFPFLCLSVSGGHTSFFIVRSFDSYECVGGTIDDAAGEALDKVAKLMGLDYPGGPIIEKLAHEVNFEDFCNYPRNKKMAQTLNFSFSGLKTAVLYDLVKRGAYDHNKGPIKEAITHELMQQVSSSLLVCIADIFIERISTAFAKYPELNGCALVGGVACNQYIRERLTTFCTKESKKFVAPPRQFCTDNGAMIAAVAKHRFEQGQVSSWDADVF